jgi:alpha-tubulin suppressor-like RCC1 family protein
VPVVATAITSGDYHSCALVDGGGIKCWGNGPAALLGAGPSVGGSSVPVDVLTINDASVVSAGGASTCAIVTGGAVKCWGGNYSGQLGDGTRDDQSIPVSVVGLSEAVTQVVVGASHACALTVSGGVKCWGRNDDQRLGDPTFPLGDVSTTAVSVLGLESGVTAISAGVNHTCAVVSGGAKCWGRNDYSALGGSSNGELIQVQTLTSGVVAVGAGAVHSCALMSTGIVNCWGAGWGGGGLVGGGLLAAASATRFPPEFGFFPRL